jgi:hypothetical protein
MHPTQEALGESNDRTVGGMVFWWDGFLVGWFSGEMIFEVTPRQWVVESTLGWMIR